MWQSRVGARARDLSAQNGLQYGKRSGNGGEISQKVERNCEGEVFLWRRDVRVRRLVVVVRWLVVSGRGAVAARGLALAT